MYVERCGKGHKGTCTKAFHNNCIIVPRKRARTQTKQKVNFFFCRPYSEIAAFQRSVPSLMNVVVAMQHLVK